MRRFYLTDTAVALFEEAIERTARKWDLQQADKYGEALRAGFQKIADGIVARSEHREEMAKGIDYKIHKVEHHYVVYQPHDKYNVIIAGLFYERMDIPTRLRELQNASPHEIAALMTEIRNDAAASQRPKGSKRKDRG
jgi:plasmid stabilization system protein ParE